jgi:hypothetical protein
LPFLEVRSIEAINSLDAEVEIARARDNIAA